MSAHRRRPTLRSLERRRPHRAAASGVVALSAAAVAAPAAYLSLLGAVGLLPRRRQAAQEPTTRFAVLVPAHDEAAGIGHTLASFSGLDYPVELFSVHVVADNCTDETADVVRRAGWCAHERDAPDDPGKGPALNWLFDRLVAQDEPFDAIVVVDADTTLDPAFLRAMDREVRTGVDAAQGYYSVRDADLSPAASFRFAALACRHHLRPQGRCRLGGSCGLYGNGMVFTRATMSSRRWSGHLVEDAELQNELLLDGELVAYVPDAVLWAEMPHDLEHASSQNQRWERGRIELAARYVPPLLGGLPRARGRRIARLDAVCDHVMPPLSVLTTLTLASMVVHGLGAAFGHRASRVALAVDIAALVAVVAHTFAGLASVGAPVARYRALLSAPRIVAWKVALWANAIRPGGEVEWTRTRRNVEVRP